jgi:hypothetical protein
MDGKDTNRTMIIRMKKERGQKKVKCRMPEWGCTCSMTTNIPAEHGPGFVLIETAGNV